MGDMYKPVVEREVFKSGETVYGILQPISMDDMVAVKCKIVGVAYNANHSRIYKVRVLEILDDDIKRVRTTICNGLFRGWSDAKGKNERFGLEVGMKEFNGIKTSADLVKVIDRNPKLKRRKLSLVIDSEMLFRGDGDMRAVYMKLNRFMIVRDIVDMWYRMSSGTERQYGPFGVQSKDEFVRRIRGIGFGDMMDKCGLDIAKVMEKV